MSRDRLDNQARIATGLIGLAGMLLACAAPLQAQQTERVPLQRRTRNSLERLEKIKEREPRPEKAKSFVESLSSNDARFEVILGQGRLLTLQEDPAQPPGTSPLIAVGDPTVVDFDVVGPRHLRLTGRRIGVTDLSVITADNENYSFEIHVVADLNYLRGHLLETFPGLEKLKLRHIREHLVVEGEATSVFEKKQIIDTVENYLKSIQADVQSQPSGGGGTQRAAPSAGPMNGDEPESDKEESRAEVIEETGGAAPRGQAADAQIIDLIRTLDPLEQSLELLQLQLQKNFPDAELKLRTFAGRIVVEGQARDTRQVKQILEMIQAHYDSLQGSIASLGEEAGRQAAINQKATALEGLAEKGANITIEDPFSGGGQVGGGAQQGVPPVVNMIRVPGPQQVMLKVEVAELNRTALREIGADLFLRDGDTTLGTVIGSTLEEVETEQGGAADAVASAVSILTGIPPGTTAFGVFDNGDFNGLVTALRQNNILKILAEPNLVAMNGQSASFRSGGEFPVPVPQSGAATGAITIEYKEFGVLVDFVPKIRDGETIRLKVSPEVSSIDFTTGVTVQGTSVPGLASRSANTVVEMQEGQTLAIAGLLQVELTGNTRRVPGLGDLPYIGPMFSNNSSRSVEKELVILVTPHLVEPMEADEVPPSPGEDVRAPDDLEFYLKGRIEKRSPRPYRATNAWDDPLGIEERREVEESYIIGPYGYSP